MNRKGRFEQFRTLIDNCEFQKGEQKTTCMDLQGFWDMIFYQVEDIEAAFKLLQEREDNGWKAVAKAAPAKAAAKKSAKAAVPKIRKVKSPSKPKSKATSSLREMMAAKRKAMITAQSPGKAVAAGLSPAPSSTSSTLGAVAKATLDPEKVFEGGFFNVRSPLRAVSASALNKSSSSTAHALTPSRSAAKSGGGARSASSALKIARVTRITRASMLNFDDAADEN